MHADLRRLLTRLMGVVATSLAPVVFTASLTIPLSTGPLPGESAPPRSVPLRPM
jgi:hypothetical protein